MNEVTYYPESTADNLNLNRARIQDKPYAKYFDETLLLSDEAQARLGNPIDLADALSPAADRLNTLLEPGYHTVENGYCELPDGTAYVASLVPFPGCTPEMLEWWFWWHSVENERYSLWHPHSHVKAETQSRDRVNRPGLSHAERYIGTTHHVDEYIGTDLVEIAIHFVDPIVFGLDSTRFDTAGIKAHACAEVNLRRPDLSTTMMLHLARETEDGFELRSRYWIGHNVRLNILGMSLPIDGFLSATGLKRRMIGERVAYEQFLHDQVEFTHLAAILPDLFHEFGQA